VSYGLGMSLVQFDVAYDSSQIRVCNAVTGFYCGHTGGALPGRMLALPKAVEIAAVPSASNNG
jgi:hypothetical protein